jgi:phosphopantetheinyl transferase (holo-ACP synthase)
LRNFGDRLGIRASSKNVCLNPPNQMPLRKTELDKEKGGWAVWEIDEMEANLAFQAQEQCPDEIVHESKRLEWLAGRITIKWLVEKMGMDYSGIRKDEFGKPYLRDLPLSISLSHSYPFVAAQISSTEEVGIDLEQPKEKLLRIAKRILAESELVDAAESIIKHCVYWCAKEALYKIDGKKGVHFANQLNVEAFTLLPRGDLTGIITRNEKRMIPLSYQLEKEFVVVYRKL